MAGRQAVLGFLVLCAATLHAAAGGADEAGFVPLFDGKTLAGWQGDLDGYDIVDGESTTVCQPDILILEGLNVLQVGAPGAEATEFVSDYFDFSIYIDADEADIENWYVARFLSLMDSVFQDPNSFFQHYAHLSRDEAVATARFIWKEINGLNLRENIEPTRDRASLILRKGHDHRVADVRLRKL